MNGDMNGEGPRKEFEVYVTFDPKSGNPVLEQWFNQDGQLDRYGDLPAETRFCPESAKAISMKWMVKGTMHREGDLPANIVRSPETDRVVLEHYLIEGLEHRSEGRPSLIVRSGDGSIEEIQYRINGVLHRSDGPAIEVFDPETCTCLEREYWLNGKKVPRLGALTSRPHFDVS